MSNQIIAFPGQPMPEHLQPAFHAPVGGPIRKQSPGTFEDYIRDIRKAVEFALAKGLMVISINADRNGAYLVVVPQPTLYKLFGDECASVQRRTEAGLVTELWLGSLDNVRVFWREVKCVH